MFEIVIKRSMLSKKSLAALFDYFSDFTTTNEWDPNTVKTILLNGDGGIGSEYSNTSKFNGKESSLVYRVIELKKNELVRLRGENKNLVAVDTMTFRPVAEGVEFTYEARFKLKGIAKLATPFLRKAFEKLGDDAEKGLAKVL